MVLRLHAGPDGGCGLQAEPTGSAEACASDRRRSQLVPLFGAARMGLPFAETLTVAGGMGLSAILDSFIFGITIRHLPRQLVMRV